MNPESYTHTELAEQAIELNLIDEGDEADLSYWDLHSMLQEYDSEIATASYYSY
jgi:hypothetical protein